MSDTPDKDDDQVLAGEYALGLLSADEAAAFEARLASEPALRAAYAQWAEDFARLAEDAPDVAPPARLKAALDKRLFEPAAAPAARPGWAQRLGFGRFYAIFFALAVVGIMLFVDLPGRPVYPPENPTYAADIVSEAGDLVVHAGFDPTNSELFVERREGRARPNRVLELWLIAGDNPPVSLGVLPEDERVRLPITSDLVTALDGGVLAISDEPPGGSPTGAPTGDVLAVATLSDA